MMASRMIGMSTHSEAEQGERPGRDAAGKASNDFELRASEQVACAGVNAITAVLDEMRRQQAVSDSGDCCLSQAWEVRPV